MVKWIGVRFVVIGFIRGCTQVYKPLVAMTVRIP
jgi:hypothetical protein